LWLPSTFFDYKPEHSTTTPHVLCLTGLSGSSASNEVHRKEILQAVAFLERSAAIAVSARPELAPRFSVVGAPLEWIAEVCESAMQERSSSQKGATDQLQQSVMIVGQGGGTEEDQMAAVVDDDKDAVDNEKDNVLTRTVIDEDGDWELLKAADAEAAIEIEAESSIASLMSMVSRMKTIAYSYAGSREAKKF
jgi:hypothetical protein